MRLTECRISSKGFQFYDSPIKRGAWNEELIEEVCFNSMIVRLKVYTVSKTGRASACFNSMIVRLKVDEEMEEIRKDECFNSMIVRLKVGMGLEQLLEALEVSIL